MYGHDYIRPLPIRSVSFSYDNPIMLQDCNGDYLSYQGYCPGRKLVRIEAEAPRYGRDVLTLEVAKDGLADECQTWDEYSMRAALIGLAKNAMMSESEFSTYKYLRNAVNYMGRNQNF